MALPVHGSTVQGNGGTASLVLSSVVVTGTDVGLIVKVAYKDNSGGLITSVVWDVAGVNEALTQVGSEANGGDSNSSLWFKAAPTSKTADVTITLSASRRIVAGASVYTLVDQSNPFRTAAVNTNTGNNDTPTVDVIALNDELVVDSMAQVSAGPDTATADHTERHNDAATGGGTDTRGASQEKSSTGATETMGWDTSPDSDDWAIVSAPLQGVQAGATLQATGAVPAQATVTGAATRKTQGAGSIPAQATVAGSAVRKAVGVGSIPAQATVSGAAIRIQQATGSIPAQATVVGAATGKLQATANVPAQATIQGAALRKTQGAGAIPGQATVVGDATKKIKATGSIPAQATVTGDATARRQGAGSIPAQATVVGAAVRVQQASGVVPAQATIIGSATRIQQATSSIAGQATVTGSAVRKTQGAGNIIGQATVTGDATVTSGGQTFQATGTITGQATVTGDARVFKEILLLLSSIARVQTLSSNLNRTQNVTSSILRTLSLESKIE